jgi:hypothetical protein
MAKFRGTVTLQKFVSIHASAHNLFKHEHDLPPRKRSNKTASPVWPNGNIS